MQGDEKPLSRLFRRPEPVVAGQGDLCWRENPVHERFELSVADVRHDMLRDDLDVGQQIRRFSAGVANPRFHLATGDADFVDQRTMLGDEWVV